MSSKLSCGSSRSRRSLAALVLVLVGCDQAPRARGVGGAVVAAPERSPTAAPALAPSAARPNILVIMSDDQRADTVRCMPRMARSLGAQGTTFTHHFASTPLCCPARSTFLTGLYPRHHGVLHNGDVEDPGDQDVDEGVAGAMLFRDRRNEERSIAVALRAAGYRTGYFGKYLNAYDRMIEREGPRVPLGWDEWRAFSHAEYYNFSLVERGIGAAAPQLKFYGTNVTQRSAQSRLRCRQTTRAGGTCVSGSGENYSTDVLAEQLDRFIQRAASDQAAWFAVLAVKSPHGPFESPARYQPNVNVASFSAAANAELASCPEFDPQWTNAAINEADITDKPAWIQRQPRRDPAALADLRRQQLVSMLAVEDAIERIDATLAHTGMRDKTVVLFVGDNGFSWGEHRYVAKNCAYESCVRVPLVVRDGRHPTLRPRALDTMTVDVDLAPTIVELAGASLPTARDGQSLVPIITGRAESTQRSEVFLSCWGRGPNRRGQPDTIAAVRTNRWKLIEHFTDATAGTLSEFELYDLQRDPLELDNLLAPRTSALSLLRFDADARQALAVLRPRLDAWRTDGAAPAASGQDAGVASDAALPSLRDWPESPPSGPSVQSMRVQGTTRIEQLIGDRDVQRVNGAQAPVAAQTDSRFGVFGTDLGYSFEHEGRLWFLFGDTRLRSHDVGAPDVLAFTDTREPPIANRLEFLRESQSSRAVFEYRPPGVAAGGSEVPSSGLSLNGRMYVLFKTDKSEDGSTDRSVLTRFDPATRAITVVREFSRLSAGGRFIKAAFALSPGGGALPFDEPVVLAWGTGHYRHSQVYLQVIRARAFEQPTAADVRFFAGRQPSGAPIWSQRESDAAPVITYGQAGDVSITRVASLGVWLALYDRRDGAGVGLAWSATAWGPFNDGGTALDPSEWRGRLLHAPNQASSNIVAGPLMNRAEERDGGTSSVGGGAYGPYVIERFTRVSEEPGRATLRLRWLLSTWNPYVVHLMESAVDVRR